MDLSLFTNTARKNPHNKYIPLNIMLFMHATDFLKWPIVTWNIYQNKTVRFLLNTLIFIFLGMGALPADTTMLL